MKRHRACPRCMSRNVGLLESLPDQPPGDDGALSYQALGSIGSYRAEYAASEPGKPTERPLKEGLVGEALKQRLLGRTWEIKSGTIEAYVCTECGYIERHVQDPAWVSYDRLTGFSWVNGPPDEGATT